MADQHPTDEFCKPHEYLVQRGNTMFICDVHGRLRIHDEEYPIQLRYMPPKPNWWDHPLAIVGLLLLPLTMVVICILLVVEHFQGNPSEQRLQARQAWEAATYRDADIHQPILRTWDGTGGMSSGISSPDATAGI